jgi:hypothetical protein
MTFARIAAALLAAAALASCDEARVEYEYQVDDANLGLLREMANRSIVQAGNPAADIAQSGSTNGARVVAAGDIPGMAKADFSKVKAPAEGADWVRATAPGLTYLVPRAWEDTTSGKPMRAREFRIPPAAGDTEPGEVVAFHFGAGQGGDVGANVTRWLGQFGKKPGDTDTALEQGTVGDLKMTIVRAKGTYAATAMAPGQAQPPRDNWAMHSVIVQGGPQGSVFFRITGPQATIASIGDTITAMAASMKPSGDAAAPQEGGDTLHANAPVPATDPDRRAAPLRWATEGYQRVISAGVSYEVPGGWKSTPPTNQMRAAQFEIPLEAGDPLELVVFHFGPGQGGTPQDNISRWARQIKPADGKDALEAAQVERAEISGLRLWSVISEGEYTPTAMSGPPQPAIPDARLHGLVIEGGPKGSLFLRLVGPRAAVAAQEAAMRHLAESARAEPEQ